MRTLIALAPFLCLASLASAATYGYNHVPLRKDSETVAGAFPDVDNIQLLSPAFLTPDVRLPGFSNGTQGPSSQDDLGKSAFKDAQ
jgi:hypothetical protein